jgi:hypothetical protein
MPKIMPEKIDSPTPRQMTDVICETPGSKNISTITCDMKSRLARVAGRYFNRG